MLAASDFHGVWAIVPTPARDGADGWSATNTVDLDEFARLVNRLIQDGVDGLIALGTTGECATLAEDEWMRSAEVVIATAAGRVPVFVGATALGTHQVVQRLRFLVKLGATGSMLGLPMWQPCTEEMALRFYAQVAEAFPNLAVMIYMNTGAFRFEFPVSFWERIPSTARSVTSAKWTRSTPHAACVSAVRGAINFLPIDSSAASLAQAAPDAVTACWSTAASMGPQPAIALMRAISARDWERAKAIDSEIAWANETFLPPNPAEFGFYNIQLEKLRMAEAGYCNPGPIRPPYHVIPDAYAARARECGRRWAELARKYHDAR